MITVNTDGNPISSGFISAVKEDSPSTMGRFWYDGAELDCDIVSVTVEKGSCGSDPFMIGEVVGDSLSATVRNLNKSIKNETIEFHVGFLVNGDYEYVSLGKFIVSEVMKTRYQSEIRAYSGVVANSSGDFNTQNLTNPKIIDLAIRLQSDLGCTISFESGIDTTLDVTAQLEGLTDYQALQVLAICCGGYIINTIDGNILVKRYNATPTLNVDTGMMVNLPEIAENPYKVRNIGVLVAEATTDNEGNKIDEIYYTLNSQEYIKVIKQGTEYYLEDESGNRIIANARPELADLYFKCIYMTQDMFEENIVPIVGYEYYPATINLTLGDPRLEGSDVLLVEEIDGELYAVPCHKITHKYSGGFTTIVKSANASDEANNIGTVLPITERLQSMDRLKGKAQATADNAYRIADNTNQYFWFRGTGTDTGAHITEVPQEQWDDSTSPYYHSGGNLLARSNGVAVRNGLTELSIFSANEIRMGSTQGQRISLTPNEMKIYDSLNSQRVKVNASDGVIVGREDKLHSVLTDAGMNIIGEDGDTSVAYFGATARIGDWDSNHVIVDTNGFTVNSDGETVARFGAVTTIGALDDRHIEIRDKGMQVFYGTTEIANIGYGTTYGASGNTDEDPYFVFGTLGSTLSSIKGRMSLSIGTEVNATGAFSCARGQTASASGWCSFASGYSVSASGLAAHAFGYNVSAEAQSQIVVGQWNVSDSDSLFIVGSGGSASTRNNALSVKRNGMVTMHNGDANVPPVFATPPASETYGCIIRLRGDGWPGSAGTMDTYWLGVGSSGKLYTGIQLNGAANVTWREK